LELLLKKGADLDIKDKVSQGPAFRFHLNSLQNGITPLMYAVQFKDIAQMLVDNGAKIDLLDKVSYPEQ
jgi:hypothetical protein